MDKTELRRRIREKKRAMTPEEIEERSREHAEEAATESETEGGGRFRLESQGSVI